MAEKIEVLFQENAKKAQLEKELETAQLVQKQFLPHTTLRGAGLQVAGASMSATECGGDWWGQKQIGKYTVVAIGDVTGHGAQAALLTAAAHGAFSVLMEDAERTPESAPDPGWIIERMNSALFKSAGEGISMSFFCSVIDTERRVVRSANAAHRPGLILQTRHPEVATHPLKAITAMAAAAGENLGEREKAVYSRSDSPIDPGSIIFWYTDGLIECESDDGRHWSKRDLVDALRESSLQAESTSDPESVAQNLMKRNLSFLGGKAASRADDITLVVAVIDDRAESREQTTAEETVAA
jgi:serine phosphatase RsbU (regulator of sigma subunit)